ncbi:hypothetical protein CJ030_MR2G003173 [Morella rubra]|uniref:Uncharacterized protein n=1 Tax=Morella rubra TaxID=262757 RepID=A0A6A1WFQ6_9ROSI|nr:hypothetical protein CJ030_MR2G003173 [Morella rubra]
MILCASFLIGKEGENDVVKNLNLVYQKGRNLHKRIYEVKKSPDQKTKIG